MKPIKIKCVKKPLKEVLRTYVQKADREYSVIDISQFCVWEEVAKTMVRYYKKFTKQNINVYQDVFQKIRGFRKFRLSKKDRAYRLNVDASFDDLDARVEWDNPAANTDLAGECFDVYLISPDEDMHIGVDFMKWSKICSYVIGKETLRHMTFADIMAHVIWEMTWHGSEEVSIRRGVDIKKKAKEAFSGKVKTISLEDSKKKSKK